MKKTNRYNKSKRNNADPPVKSAVHDSFSNPLARLGLGSNSLLESTQYPIDRKTRDYNLMNSLYRNSWIAKKIINTIPEDMCKNWFSLSAELSPEQQDRYDKLERRTLVREKMVEGLTWGRLYGGAGAIMLIAGQEDILNKPLDIESVMPNSFKGLLIVDRWSGIYPGIELITDINDPEFGLPEFYDIKDINGSVKQKVHHSRVIRFIGRKLPFWEDQTEMHWGASELEHVFPELAKRDNTSWNIASLVFQANLLVNKVDGLDQLISLGDVQAQEDLYNLKTAQNQMRSNSSMMIIGDKDEVSALNYTFAGLSDISDSQMMDVSGACDIPVTKLFGRSPAGMNSTGESDMQMYYDMVGGQQESVLKPKINKLLPVMFMSEFGKIPDDLGVKFNPIATPSDDKVAEIVGKKVDSIAKVYDSGVITQKIAMKELHEISYTTGMFTNITDEDIESANDDYIDESLNDFSVQDSKVDEIKIAIDSEKEAIEMYKGQIQAAKDSGDTSIIPKLKEILGDEEDHLKILQAM
ncbi:DUF1073 domain-containing protein (plasmid) [Clostridium estertheticum]|uniref:anti-CBASS protein Acb1 family protein n=1 Tax=Clostridium estertheticum TaxID=238834 RepID=UPI001C7DC77F|nr:anti-CBASS Acb1 family protein [Clostridium estertheticum]MBX4259747.1 DUF1073 domain-containing protein [Clostridium estertheticum]WLC73243.1 DUF1073 domain-containing protein [Clostridium estertheticum]